MKTERHVVPSARLSPYRLLQSSRFAVKVARYAIGSVVALLTSVIVFALLLDAGVGTTPDSALAFVAGALPNWILNRRWAWERTGEMDVTREVLGYTLISLLALAASSAGTGWADALLRHHLSHQHTLRVLLVTLAYVAVQGVLFVAKFVAYDRWVFTESGRIRAAVRARRAHGSARQAAHGSARQAAHGTTRQAAHGTTRRAANGSALSSGRPLGTEPALESDSAA